MKEFKTEELKQEIRELEKDLATIRERSRFNEEKAKEGLDNQIRAFENQLDHFKTEVQKRAIEAEIAKSHLTDATWSAWRELRQGVNKAMDRMIH